MAGFRSLDDVEVTGRRVLVRADLNVPVHDGRVSDDTRIRHLVPTVGDLVRRGARVVLLSHFGRPGGRRGPAMSLPPVVPAGLAAASATCPGEPPYPGTGSSMPRGDSRCLMAALHITHSGNAGRPRALYFRATVASACAAIAGAPRGPGQGDAAAPCSHHGAAPADALEDHPR